MTAELAAVVGASLLNAGLLIAVLAQSGRKLEYREGWPCRHCRGRVLHEEKCDSPGRLLVLCPRTGKWTEADCSGNCALHDRACGARVRASYDTVMSTGEAL